MTSALNHRYPEVQGEFEDELEAEDEFEDEFEEEDEFENEEFLGALGGIARTVGGLLGGDAEFEEEAAAEFEFEAEAEGEFEAEDESEDEAFVNPVQRIYRDAELMAHLSRQAAASEGEEEAEAFLGALVPLAARLIPRAAALVSGNAPALIRGVTTIGRRLRGDPATRRLIQALPVVLQRTAQSLADQAASGRTITADRAVTTLARVTGRVLQTPASCRSAVHAVDVFDRRYRQRARRTVRRQTVPHAGGPAYGQPGHAQGGRQQSPPRKRRTAKSQRRGRRTR